MTHDARDWIARRDAAGRIVEIGPAGLEALRDGRRYGYSGVFRITCSRAGCNFVALAGKRNCRMHTPGAVKMQMQAALKAGDPVRIARAARKLAYQALRRQWRRDPWSHGWSITFAPGIEDQFQIMITRAAIDRDHTPCDVMDRLRWRFRRAVLDRQGDAVWQEGLRFARRNIQLAPPRPAGWRYEPPPEALPPHAVHVAAAPPPGSKRRLRPRSAPATKPAW